jgi:hypothetical protein
MRTILVLLFSLFAPALFAQSANTKAACNDTMTFCWYGPYQDGSDDVTAWGTVWKSDDANEKSLEYVTEVRCIKRLRVCINARNQKGFFDIPRLTNIDLYNVRSWNNTEIRAVMDEITWPDCEQNTLVINRVERSAVVISSPGPRGNEKQCTGIVGQPKTVVYRLAYPEMDKLGAAAKGKQK